MQRDYAKEFEKRVAFIREQLAASGCRGIVYGNSGGKDSVLVGILCRAACENTLGVMLPCGSSCNYKQDMEDAEAVARQYDIRLAFLDLADMKLAMREKAEAITTLSDAAIANIAPRLRMTALYLLAQSRNALVVGTGNRCEIYMGYFTKWGDGAYDLDPIADLTVSEIYDFLRWLKAPLSIIEKAPSAGLFEGQTDEGEMGVSYAEIESYMQGEAVSEKAAAVIERYHRTSEHKRRMPAVYKGE